MPRTSTYAAIRFGLGFAPSEIAPDGADAMLEQLRQPDHAATTFPVAPFITRASLDRAALRARADYRRQKTAESKALLQAAQKPQHTLIHQDRLATMARSIYGPHGFRERLVMFWADHFTTRSKRGITQGTVANYINDAIRPNIAGNFGDLLRDVTLHPMMLIYLDQSNSIGPNSDLGKSKGRGLNENLARELLELHTLGAGGAYTQDDVRQLAELLTGLTGGFSADSGFSRRRAEPGPETVLGKTYGGWKPKISDIHEVLADLAIHPDTARHISRKLVVHFISDQPDPDLVQKMTDAFLTSGGDLMAVYDAMLSHDLAWQGFGGKVKRPDEYMYSAIRALGVRRETFVGMNSRSLSNLILGPMALMDQPFQQPNGPDGFAEEASAWLLPQSLAGRIQWAMSAPRSFKRSDLDPREFVNTALQDAAGDTLRFAARAAESKWEGLGLILASPEFNRR